MRTSINNRRITIATLLVAVGLVVTAGTASTATAADVLRTAAQQGVANGCPGVIGLVEENGVATTVSAGVGNRSTNAAADPTARFRIGSVTKTFVAADLLRLESEGKLSIDDTVAKWLPGVVNADGNGRPDCRTSTSTRYTPQQLVNIALTPPPTSAPWRAW